jgi:hypothetical protein
MIECLQRFYSMDEISLTSFCLILFLWVAFIIKQGKVSISILCQKQYTLFIQIRIVEQ